MKSRFVLLFLFLISLTVGAQSKDFPAKPNPPRLVNDFVGMLSAAEVSELEQKVNRFNDSTSIEISIVIISNLGDYDISDYAFQLGEQWGIGKKAKNNGVLLLIAKENRKAFIATGYGMEGVLPDMRCKRIIESELIPQFKQSNYFNGINFTIDAIMRYSANEYTADPVQQKGFKPGYVFLFILIAILIIGFINRKNQGDNPGGNSGGGNSGFLAGLLGGAALGSTYRNSGGGFGGGFGGSSSSGGFGGFGGGGFGGGGSGGSW